MESRWQRRSDALTRTSLDAVLISAAESSEPFSLSGPGLVIWELLAKPITTTELVAHLAASHNGDPAQVRADIEPVLTQLLDRGAIRRAADPTVPNSFET